MSVLKITLLGQTKIELNGVDVSEQLAPWTKASALLFYVVLSKQRQERQQLALLLWDGQDADPQKALRNLRGRVGLTTLRKVLPRVIDANRQSIGIADDVDVWCDALEFVDRLSKRTLSMEALEAALALYSAEFWPTYNLTGVSDTFDEWVYNQKRPQYRKLALNGLEKLTQFYLKRQIYDKAALFIERMLQIEACHEQAFQLQMQFYGDQGHSGMALSYYEQCRQQLRTVLGVEPSVTFQQLAQQIRANTYQAPPPIPFMAPAVPATFINREPLLEQIRSLIQRKQPPIIAIVGMGGVGKTTFAAYIAQQLRLSFEHGILWAAPSISTPREIIGTWAQLFDYNLRQLPDLTMRAIAWRGLTKDKQLLLILDDVHTAADVRPLQPNSPQSTIIITTRNRDVAHALNASVFELPLLTEDTALLLLQQIVDPTRISAEPKAATAICAQVEHLPLALELAAQRLRSRPRLRLATFLQQLANHQQRLQRLSMGDRAVYATFDLSWQQLPDHLRYLFASMALFAGRDFSVDALAALVEQSADLCAADVDELTALSLVHTTSADRYRQHALLATYAAQKAADMPVSICDAQRLRYISYYRHLAQNVKPNDPQLEAAWHNLLAAIDAAAEAKLWRSVYALVHALTPVWFRQTRYESALNYFNIGRNAAMRLENDFKVAFCTFQHAKVLVETADFDTAIPELEQCEVWFEQLGQPTSRGETQLLSARIAMERGAYTQAEQYLNRAQQLYQSAEDLEGQANTRFIRGNIAYHQSEFDVALKQYDTALAQLQNLQPSELYLDILHWAATTAVILYQAHAADTMLQMAKQYATQAADINQTVQSREQSAKIAALRASICRLQQQFEDAKRWATQSTQIRQRNGDRLGEANMLIQLATIESERFAASAEPNTAALSLAHTYLDDALKIILDIGSPLRESIVYYTRGNLFILGKQPDAACAQWAAAHTLAKQANHSTLLENLETFMQKYCHI